MSTVYNIDLNKTKTLLAGPWVGEFGWEIICWQGYIRSIASKYKKVIVMSRTGNNFLYQDFADEFIEYNPPEGTISIREHCEGITHDDLKNIIKNISYDVWIPPHNIGFFGSSRPFGDEFKSQQFITFKSDSLNEKYDIIIHPRKRKFDAYRNWDGEKWQNLVNMLYEKYSIAVIGNDESYALNNVKDCRNLPLSDVVSLLNRCKLLVNPISGPAHLATLCSTTQLAWAANAEKFRCMGSWNPLQAPIYYIVSDNYDPDINIIYNEIIKILNGNNKI